MTLTMDELQIKAPVTQANLKKHVFVCTGKSCSANDAEATLEAFWAVLKERNLLYGKRGTPDGTVLVARCGSVGLCAVGPAVLIYPEGTWYYGVTPNDVAEIVDEHIIGGYRVARLLACEVNDGVE